MKRKNDYYLTTSDIEELHQRYSKLYKQVQNDFDNNDTSKNHQTRTCEILLGAYNREVEELNELRYPEYLKRKAEREAKNEKQIPWRRCWLWRLILRPLTNRAQDIIEERAELEAEKLFTAEEQKLDELEEEIYGANAKRLSARRRKKALKKYLKYKRLLNLNDEAAVERFEAALDKASENAPPFTEPPEPPARKPRKTKQQSGVEPL